VETTNALHDAHPAATDEVSVTPAAHHAAPEVPVEFDERMIEALADVLARQLAPHLRATTPDAEYLTLAEVARRTSFGYDFVYHAVRDGHLPAVKKGRDWRVAVTDMRAWMNKDRAGVTLPARSRQRERVSRLMPGLTC
jgi:excisionase family DNA binding protein